MQKISSEKMNLTADIGNTLAKVVLFEHEKPVVHLSYKVFNVAHARLLLKKYKIEYAIVSSVVKTLPSALNFLRKNSRLIELSPTTRLPFRNKYKTRKTLGNDRVASVAGASTIFPRKNVLVIDLGTCIKYDFINKDGEYRGGSISPGLNMRLRSLHEFTGKLPLLKPAPTKDFIGRSTHESILTGVQNGIIYEMHGFINSYKKKYPDLKIVLTGGDHMRFVKPLNLSIFAAPDLVNIGLHAILLRNVSK